MKIVIEDTRNVLGKHKNINKWFLENGYEVIRNKLMVGDYSTPNVMNKISIDTKKDMLELLMDITIDHDRFKRELLLANKLNIKLVVLIEESDHWNLDNIHLWKSPVYKTTTYKTINNTRKVKHLKNEPISKVKMETMQKILRTLTAKYGVQFVWCDKINTAQTILSILEKEY